MNEEERRHKEVMAAILGVEARIRQLREQKAPKIGPFYVVDGEVYCDGSYRDLSHAGPDGTVRQGSHEEAWRQVVALFRPEIASVGPYHYPRGRVVYSEDRQRFFLYADWCIIEDEKRGEFVQKVCREFNLDQSLVEVLPSPDYRCSACR